MILNIYSYIKVWQHIGCRKNCTTVQREGGREGEGDKRTREGGQKEGEGREGGMEIVPSVNEYANLS